MTFSIAHGLPRGIVDTPDRARGFVRMRNVANRAILNA